MTEVVHCPDTGSGERFVVGEHEGGERLDVFVAAKIPHLSRSRIRAAIDAGELELDGAPAAKAGQKLKPGQYVHIRSVPAPEPLSAEPQNIPLHIRYEDASVLVVSKPAGLVVHPAPGHSAGTLVNAIAYHTGALPDGGDPVRPGIVHRLDKDTSGLMVVAKTDAAQRALSAQLQDRSASRLYLAILLGRRLADEGTFETPYGRHPVHRQRFTSRTGDRRAITHWRVLARGEGTALVAARLETGRTHQIRVHFAEAGYPMAGDELYGGVRVARGRSHVALRAIAHLPRHALHAAGLAFLHPADGHLCIFVDPWPTELQVAAEALFGEAGAQSVREALETWAVQIRQGLGTRGCEVGAFEAGPGGS